MSWTRLEHTLTHTNGKRVSVFIKPSTRGPFDDFYIMIDQIIEYCPELLDRSFTNSSGSIGCLEVEM